MDKRSDLIVKLIKEDLGFYLKLSFGVFLFILFFRPFSLERFDFNNQLIFVFGLGSIELIVLVLVRVLKYLFFRKYDKNRPDAVIPKYLEGFIMVAISSVAFAFYIKFVGRMGITFHVMFKIGLICLAPPFLLSLNETIKHLKNRNVFLVREKGEIREKIEKYEQDYLNKTVEFVSENSSQNLILLIADVAFIKSADNYVEIAYLEEDIIKKTLIRNTLKNIEHQLRPYSNFIRCHRMCIVNEHFIGELHQDGSHWLSIRGSEEKIPVSRQYLLKLKEII